MVDPDLTQIFLDRIEVLQEFVDNSIQTAQEKEWEWAKAEEEALHQAQEHMRFVAQLEEQRKVDEENAKCDKMEAARREKEEIIAKAQKLAEEEDPNILEVFPEEHPPYRNCLNNALHHSHLPLSHPPPASGPRHPG